MNNLHPTKIINKGSQGIVLMTDNNELVVKIYFNKHNFKMINIIKFLKKNNIPTIYKTLFFTERKNSLQRYISDNLPQHFSYISEDNLLQLSSKYNMKPTLFEIMKKYDITLNDFIFKLFLNDNTLNIQIIKSLFYQGILTLLWLYMKKSIIHFDINTNNFFVEKTDETHFNIVIHKQKFSIPLYGYYLIIADFGHSNSIELFEPIESQLKTNLKSYRMHPFDDINNFIRIFRKYLIHYNITLDDLNMDFNKCNQTIINKTKKEYINMIKSYYEKTDFKVNVDIFKNKFFEIIHKYILNFKDF